MTARNALGVEFLYDKPVKGRAAEAVQRKRHTERVPVAVAIERAAVKVHVTRSTSILIADGRRVVGIVGKVKIGCSLKAEVVQHEEIPTWQPFDGHKLGVLREITDILLPTQISDILPVKPLEVVNGVGFSGIAHLECGREEVVLIIPYLVVERNLHG